MEKYPYFEKYKLQIVDFRTSHGTGTGFTGNPKYPNGYLLSIIAGHTPMRFKHYRNLTIEEEIKVIRSILKTGNENERYPLVDEIGQIAIYKKVSYVYDTMTNGGVFNDFESLNNSFDEKDEKPIMVLPSEDILGILEDFNKWKIRQGENAV